MSITKVKLRQKPILGNKQSLYLDFYPAIIEPENGKETRRQFLNLFLHDEILHEVQKYTDANGKPQMKIVPVLDRKGAAKKSSLSPTEKLHNKETITIAESIRQKRDNQLNKPEIYNEFEKEQLSIRKRGELSFIEYFKQLADKRKKSNHDNWISAYHYLVKFAGDGLKFSELDEKVCNDFKDHLLNSPSNKSSKVKLAQNSAVSYFNKFKAALKQANKDGLLSTDLNARIETIKQEETEKENLTIEELNALVKTDCGIPILKNAALFSALTSLRHSDIIKLTWSEIEFIKDQGYFINFQQKKTKGMQVQPISEQAYSLLGERGAPDQAIFKDLFYSAWHNQHLWKWITKAGITKEIKFHNFRHTYAVLQLYGGTDIYTVSKMLGHKNLRTTQVYANIVDEKKREASNKIQLDM